MSLRVVKLYGASLSKTYSGETGFKKIHIH